MKSIIMTDFLGLFRSGLQDLNPMLMSYATKTTRTIIRLIGTRYIFPTELAKA